MAFDGYSRDGSLYGSGGTDPYDNASLYRTPTPTTSAPAPRSRSMLRPVGILTALAAIAAGGVVYVATGHAAAAVNPNCTLIVPANPLSAKGLATPYQLVATNAANGPCNEANAGQSAFVQGAILSPGGAITLYDPLVIDKGTKPLAAPAPATVPAGSTVALWFGFNGTNLTLKAANGTNSLAAGRCVNGLNNSIFGQFSYCNAPAFFSTANMAIAAGQLVVPPLAMAKDGKPCPTVRDFSVVDQDQSDNVVTHYLANAKGRTAQPNAAGMAAAGANVVDLANGSDNRLLDAFVDPTLGCTPWMAPNQSNGNIMTSSLPLNELSAAVNQKPLVAVVPLTDPMALNNNQTSARKTNLYRAGVDQPMVGTAANGSGAAYCKNLFTNPAGIARVFAAQTIYANGMTPDAATGTNLFTFLAARASASFTNLNCQNFGLANPIKLTLNGAGVAIAATFTAPAAAAAAKAAVAAPAAAAPVAAAPVAAATGTAPVIANPTAAGTVPVIANPTAAAGVTMMTTAAPAAASKAAASSGVTMATAATTAP